MVRKLKYGVMIAVTPVVLITTLCLACGVLDVLIAFGCVIVLIACAVCSCFGLQKLIDGD